MTTITPPLPATAVFTKLGSIWLQQADGLDALGRALKAVLGTDLDLAEEAASLRRRAQNPQQYWPSLVERHAPTSQAPQWPNRYHPEGLYGPIISNAARTKLDAAACCASCQAALQVSAAALHDFASWLAQHVYPSKAVGARATWERTEANHLSAWANKLRAEALQEATTGIAT